MLAIGLLSMLAGRRADVRRHGGLRMRRRAVAAGVPDARASTPRERHGRFEPRLVEKHVRRLPGFDDKAISMYAHEIAACV